MITWGISSNSHNAALAVFSNDSLMFASQSERFSRKKNDPYICVELINHAYKYGEPELICWYEQPLKKKLRQIMAGQGPFQDNFTKYFDCKHKFIDHHYSHACAGYFTSKFQSSAILVIDGIGETTTMSIWIARGKNITRLWRLKYPNSIGLWYSAMTQRCGFKPNEEEYLMMGLSAYGKGGDYVGKIFNELIGMDFECKQNMHRGIGDWQPEACPEEIAAASQTVYNTLFCNALSLTKRLTGSDNVVIMGGCALNCAANTHAYDFFKRVWIMPAPDDAGSAIGAVLAHKKVRIPFTPYLGYKILHQNTNASIVEYLRYHKICGLARGRAEFGPRALGARSLLADPTVHNIKDVVNTIKNRQSFRPFAPVVPIEFASKYFDMHDEMVESPFMQYTVKCKMPKLLPGVVHVDGTSRVQTVKKSDAPRLHDLLLRWGKISGHPVLLNTSLNTRGEPILNDEYDVQLWSQKHGVRVFS